MKGLVVKLIIAVLLFGLSFALAVLVMDRSLSEDSASVSRVIDGDTVEMSDGAVVRLAGIDTPERGACGFSEASDRLSGLVMGQPVTLVEAGSADTDRYGRLVRYIEVEGQDAGLVLIEEGLAKARYDSRDGYGAHQNEELYISADNTSRNYCDNEE